MSSPLTSLHRHKKNPSPSNPFSIRSNKSQKFSVLNRRVHGSHRDTSRSTSKSLSSRSSLSAEYKNRNSSNKFKDKRFGVNDGSLSTDTVMLERFKRERVHQSKKANKYNLAPSIPITHKGEKMNSKKALEDTLDFDDSDDEKVVGNLDKADTQMHFGGGSLGKRIREQNPYGSTEPKTLSEIYAGRVSELDDVIRMSKVRKMEKRKMKEEQAEGFEGVDSAFDELRGLLNFRDNGVEKEEERMRRKRVRLGEEEGDDNDLWESEVKMLAFEKKSKASDRTKTIDEIRKEEAEELKEKEERRLKRMKGDFEGDDLSDVEDNEMKITAEGIKYVDKFGNDVTETSNPNESEPEQTSDSEDSSQAENALSAMAALNESDSEDDLPPLPVGSNVSANFRANEQFQGDGGDVQRNIQCEGLKEVMWRIKEDEEEGVKGVWTRRVGFLERKEEKIGRDTEVKVGRNGRNREGEEEFSTMLGWGDIFLGRMAWEVFSSTDARHGVLGRLGGVFGRILEGAIFRTGDELRKGCVVAEGMVNLYQERWCSEVVGFLVDVVDFFAGEKVGRIKLLKPEKVPVKMKLTETDEREMVKGCLDMCIVLGERIAKVWRTEVEATSNLLESFRGLMKVVKDPRVKALVTTLDYKGPRPEIRLRAKKTTLEKSVVSLDPRINEDDKYRHSKDKGKEKQKAIRDKMQRDFKRTKKAAKRELKLDSQHLEKERRAESDKRSGEQKEKRHKNFAWLEQEQATINQQVREGGGLMKGGGTGAGARAKARGKLGVKKGGKK
ncbi:hypothetical protein TrST_g3243 [Triparma strigata]|uniref:Uncharacterized protein n=1 Tax=Triparma strigata TaxID=1606541 RepID=A0A9W7EK57_9STRA|nr:hypothetical protein TrST_g3243 [Triparma strigata]